MKADEIVRALKTGDMGQHGKQFNPAPSGRVEFGQVYVIPADLRNAIISALAPKTKSPTKKHLPPSLAHGDLPTTKGKSPE